MSEASTGSEAKPEELSHLYRHRFTQEELEFKRVMWRVLCRDFFQRYVDPESTVLDLGAGTCEFINEINASTKIVVDANPDVADYAKGSRVVIAFSTDMKQVESASVDVVFSSNFFEHLPNKEAILGTLRECARVLRPNGKLLILMPNIRYLGGRYWDYFDHHTPLTHLSLQEALGLCGFVVDEVIPKFLPYTVKGARIPKRAWLVSLYLKLRPAWFLFGRQMLLTARKDRNAVAQDHTSGAFG